MSSNRTATSAVSAFLGRKGGGADIYWPMMTLIFFFGGKREEVDRTIGTIGTKGAKETTIDKSPGRSAETTNTVTAETEGTKKKKDFQHQTG